MPDINKKIASSIASGISKIADSLKLDNLVTKDEVRPLKKLRQ